MPDDPRVQGLIEEMLDTGSTPEAVCFDTPELLSQVREVWARFRALEGRVEELFPGPDSFAGRCAMAPEEGLPRIPGYDLTGVLGRGGVGVVYKAVHHGLNRTVALKMLLAGSFATRAERERFAREGELVASLRHPSIVQVYDVGDLDGRPFFTMEWLEGGSLAERLAGTPRPAREAAELSAELADAIAAAHRGGVVHRDLKPSNVLLTCDGVPKIGDFGLARRLDLGPALTRTGAMVGTPSYMAPEQACGRSSEAGPAADLYALGAILYELLTGRPPFRAESATETLRQVVEEDPVAPSRLNAKVPRDLGTICLNCLRKDPAMRYESAEALSSDLRRFLAGEAIAARPENGLQRLARRVRRRPAIAAAFAAAALSTVTLACVGALMLSERWAVERAAKATEKAADDDLREMNEFLAASRWAEAKAAHERARGRLGQSNSAGLNARLERGTRDIALAAELEEIRLVLSGGGGGQSGPPHSPERMYAGAFRNYGLDLLRLDPEEAAARVRDSAVRDTIVAFLHDWLYWISDSDRARVQAVTDLVDDDQWRRDYRVAIGSKERDVEKLKALAASPVASAQSPLILSGLCGALLAKGRRAEVTALLTEAQQLHPEDFWLNYLVGHFWASERPQLAVGYLRAAVAIRPTSDQAYNELAIALLNAGDTDAAIAAFDRLISLLPNHTVVRRMAKLLAPKDCMREVLKAWDRVLARDPPDFDSWYGHAQLCLYLGDEKAYRASRKALLGHFGDEASDWHILERAALACYLLPASAEDSRRIDRMIGRLESLAPRPPHPDAAYIQFVGGLAEYRNGRPERAIARLGDSAEKLVDRPGPRLVLAMAQFRTGSTREARRSLARAVSAYDWTPGRADHTTAWVSHVLRREAEALILPNLPAFLDGTRQPEDDDERLALIGVCQATDRPLASCRLYLQAFAADPQLAEDLRTGHRYKAALAAGRAGCGLGVDAKLADESEWGVLRDLARRWLRADLAALGNTLDADPVAGRERVAATLSHWLTEPALVALREPAGLEKLAIAERTGWIELWKEVRAMAERAGQPR